MCMGGGGGGWGSLAPVAPPDPPPPIVNNYAAPPPVPTQADAAVTRARNANTETATANVGRNATILTRPTGVLTDMSSGDSQRKTLLGQ